MIMVFLNMIYMMLMIFKFFINVEPIVLIKLHITLLREEKEEFLYEN